MDVRTETGYPLVTVKTRGRVTLYSRRRTDLSKRFECLTAGLASLPDETVIDGELVALGNQRRSDFNLLQNFLPTPKVLEPGAHRLQALLKTPDALVVTPPVGCRVAHPRSSDEEIIAQRFFTTEVSRAFAFSAAVPSTEATKPCDK